MSQIKITTTIVVILMTCLLAIASANTCGANCESDNDCHQGGFVECGKCNLYRGTLGYKTCYNDQPEPAPAPAPTSPAHDYFPIGGSCSYSCRNDRDCQQGGFNPCGKCGHNAGTIMYQRCYQPENEGRHIDSCGVSCDSDSDCHQGGFVECGKCNLYQGTLGFKTCYNDQPEPPTPAPSSTPSMSPTHNFFPLGGSCKQECTTNADCQNGGFNPCGECGQLEGTEMYHICYKPEGDDDEGSRRLDSCGASCNSDRDCHQGGFVTCGKCNLYKGSLGYKTCYNNEAEPTSSPPTPAPTHDYFPIGGSCRNECETNADCQIGGYSPCGKCGQVQGTEMYHVCYQPSSEGRRLRGTSM